MGHGVFWTGDELLQTRQPAAFGKRATGVFMPAGASAAVSSCGG
jgi:hypothetical protein